MLLLLRKQSKGFMFAVKKTSQPLGKTPDQILISRYLKSGEECYINELFRRYHHLIFGTCLKFLKDPEESKDMTMIIFEKLFKKLKNQPVMAFNQWLYSLCCNECKNKLRNRDFGEAEVKAWQVHYEEQDTGKDSEEEVIEDLFEPEEITEASETIVVQRAISKLPATQRKCVRFFFLQEMSYKEIAEKTSLEVKEVKSHLQNGKRRLKQLLEARFGNHSINNQEPSL